MAFSFSMERRIRRPGLPPPQTLPAARAAACPAMIRSARTSVSNWLTLARTWAISRPAGVDRSSESLTLTRLILRLQEIVEQGRQAASGAAEAVKTPNDDGRHLAGLNVRLQLVPAGPVHRLAGETVLVPLDGLVLGGGPAFQVGKLRANVLAAALADTDVKGDMTHGACLQGCTASMLRASLSVKCDLKPTIDAQKWRKSLCDGAQTGRYWLFTLSRAGPARRSAYKRSAAAASAYKRSG